MPAGAVQVPDEPGGPRSAEHLPDQRNARARSRNAPPDLFCRIIKPPDHPAAHFRCRGQILAALAGEIQPGDRLVEV
jgi:hypothetical protein